MFRPSISTVLVLSLSIFQLCSASGIFGFIDYFLLIRTDNVGIIQATELLQLNPEAKCRTALRMKDNAYVSVLAYNMPSLSELVISNSEFVHNLTCNEQRDILKLYFEKFVSGQNASRDVVFALMAIFSRDQDYENFKIALENNIIDPREALIYFANNQILLAKALDSDILNYLDITQSIIVDKSILHIIAESGNVSLLEKIFALVPRKIYEKVKRNHLTKIEKNSILHSAVLSNDPETIEFAVKKFYGHCGHTNFYEMTPLTLSFVNENSFESIKVLLKNGCVTDWDNITFGPIDFNEDVVSTNLTPEFYDNFRIEMEKSLRKLFHWDPPSVGDFYETFNDAFKCIDSTNFNSLKVAYFLGLMNSYRKFLDDFDKILIKDFIKSPFARSTSFSPSFDSGELRIKSQDIWSMVSKEAFNFNSRQIISLSPILNGLSFNIASPEVKKQFFLNLSKIDQDLIDYCNVNLGEFIKSLISFSDPEIFALIVNRDLEYYFCIRTMFKLTEDLSSLIPFLDAMGFDINTPFIDGLYPIHFAVVNNDLRLVNFLMTTYKADLETFTVYDHSNILHLALKNSTSSIRFIDFVLLKVPILTMYTNIYHISPLESAMFSSENLEIIEKCLPILGKYSERNIAYEFPQEVVEIYNEIVSQLPLNTGWERYFQDNLLDLFLSSNNDKNARLLFSFISKKILKHLIKAKPYSSINISKFQYKPFSPASIDTDYWSPKNP